MMRSMFSGVSGLRNHQTRMDVIGNNIANVNTTGYKRERANFATMLSQTLRGASAPIDDGLGGTNPSQVGLGVQLSSISRVIGTGSTQTTGVQTDLKIDGPGFFVVSSDGVDKMYTRAGNFSLDSVGNLVTESGLHVLDEELDPIVIELNKDDDGYVSYDIDKQGVISGRKEDGTIETIQCIAIAIFPNNAGLTSIGGNNFVESANSGTPKIYGAEGGDPYPASTTIVPSALEMSNVDLSEEFTDMIITQRGFQANSRIITVSDTLLEELINLKR